MFGFLGHQNPKRKLPEHYTQLKSVCWVFVAEKRSPCRFVFRCWQEKDGKWLSDWDGRAGFIYYRWLVGMRILHFSCHLSLQKRNLSHTQKEANVTRTCCFHGNWECIYFLICIWITILIERYSFASFSFQIFTHAVGWSTYKMWILVLGRLESLNNEWVNKEAELSIRTIILWSESCCHLDCSGIVCLWRDQNWLGEGEGSFRRIRENFFSLSRTAGKWWGQSVACGGRKFPLRPSDFQEEQLCFVPRSFHFGNFRWAVFRSPSLQLPHLSWYWATHTNSIPPSFPRCIYFGH